MNITDSILLGTLQGVTEFLPVSSSGHLTLLQHFLGLGDTPLIFDIYLHAASLIAVVIFFRKRITDLTVSLFKKNRKNEKIEILFLLLSTVITALMLPLTRPVVYYIKEKPQFLLFSFLFTAVILLFTDKILKKRSGRSIISLKDSIMIGLFQGLAVFPGISRSGSTICAGLFSGLKGDKSFEYSFILAIPAISGALLLESVNADIKGLDIHILIAGCFSSLVFSLISLQLLSFLIRKTLFKPFAFYLIFLSFVVLKIFWL